MRPPAPHRLLFGLAFAQAALGLLAWTIPAHAPALAGGVEWHAHEMVFGYALAIIAGFLLTRISGAMALAIAGAWLAARLANTIPGVPLPLRAALSLAGTAAIALPAARTFLRGAKQASTMIFPAIVSAFLLAEAMFQLGELAAWDAGVAAGRWLGLGLVILLILAMGGRLVGAAASGAAQRRGGLRIAPQTRMERALLALLVLGFVAEGAGAPPPLVALPVAAGAGLIGLRVWYWAPGLRHCGADVLAVAAGQAWLGAGLFAWAAAMAGLLPLPASAALHLATIGGIGGTTLVMAMRASAQREARPMPLRAAPAVATLIAAAALLRAFGPAELYGAAAALWAAASVVAAVLVFWRRARR